MQQIQLLLPEFFANNKATTLIPVADIGVSIPFHSIRKASPPDERLQCAIRLGMISYAKRPIESEEVRQRE